MLTYAVLYKVFYIYLMSLIAQEIKIKQLVSLKRICTYKRKTCQHSWKARKEGMK